MLVLGAVIILLKGAAHAYHYARNGAIDPQAHPIIRSKWLGLHETDLVFGWALYVLLFLAGCDVLRIWAMQTVAHIGFQVLINLAEGWRALDSREGRSWDAFGVAIPKLSGPWRLLKLPIAAVVVTYEIWLPPLWVWINERWAHILETLTSPTWPS